MLALRLAALLLVMYALLFAGHTLVVVVGTGFSVRALGPAVVTLGFALAAAGELWRGRAIGYLLGLTVAGIAAVFSLYHGVPLIFRPRGADALQLAYWSCSLVLSLGTVALLALPSARQTLASTGPAV